MRKRRIALLSLFVFCAAIRQGAAQSPQNLGTAPVPALDAADIYTAFQLRVNDQGTPAASAVAGLQVGDRARRMGITSQTPSDAWFAAQALLAGTTLQIPPAPANSFTYTGSTVAGLNAAIANTLGVAIRVATPALTVDQPIEIARDGMTLDLGSTQLMAADPSPTNLQPWIVRVTGAKNVTITGGHFIKGNSGILINKSTGVLVENTQMAGLTGDGIVVTASTRVTLAYNRFSGLGGPGVVLHGGSTQCVVERNDAANGVGQSNWMAGMMITDRDVDLARDPHSIFGPDGFGPVAEPINGRLNPPHDNLIALNHIETNLSSGVYMDGGIRNVIYSNTIVGNAKEGLCLDNGATANVVASNVIQQNGKRWGQTDLTLRLDSFPTRLPDGSAAAKVPGVSVDNALYNVVFGNNISHNFGGGVKMVRTSYFNLIGLNVLDSDNDGVSNLYRFVGIELGTAPGGPAADLDFTPSRGNVLFSNVIRGSNGSGIYVGFGSDSNSIVDNVIMDARDWAIQSELLTPNTMQNNLTSLKSLNSAGCCLASRPVQQPR